MSRGKHRTAKPSTTTQRVAGVAVALATTTTGSLSLAGIADAAQTVNWEKVAACESGGDWSINTGNGFSGGLQFSDSTWRVFGGTTAHAYQASEATQIAVADKALAGQGIGAWPVCGPRGLGAGSSSPAPHQAPTTPAVSTPASITPSTTPTTSGRHTAAPTPSSARVHSARVHIVVAGDTLTSIAATAGVTWRELATLNPQITNPDVVFVGDHVTLPAAGDAAGTVSSRPTPATNPAAADTPSSSIASSSGVVATARGWIGTPYLYGGNTRSGIDCSGLVQQVFKANGKNLPRTADQQLHAVRIIPRSQAASGDLVFGVQNGAAHHVGIFLGGNSMIDAPDVGQTVGVHTLYYDSTVFGQVL